MLILDDFYVRKVLVTSFQWQMSCFIQKYKYSHTHTYPPGNAVVRWKMRKIEMNDIRADTS